MQQMNRLNDPFVYSSGESDTEFATHFNELHTSEKSTRIKFLWNKIYNRARGGLFLIQKLKFNQEKIRLFGSASKKNNDDDEEVPKYVLFPENKFLVLWNMLGAVILLIIAF